MTDASTSSFMASMTAAAASSGTLTSCRTSTLVTNPISSEHYLKMAVSVKGEQKWDQAFVNCFKALYLADSEEKYKAANALLQEILDIINKLEVEVKPTPNIPQALQRTRSARMYYGLAEGIGFDAERAQTILKNGYVIIDHEIDFVFAFKNGRDLISLGAGREGILINCKTLEKQIGPILNLPELFKKIQPKTHTLAAKLEAIASAIRKVVPYKDYSGKDIVELYKFCNVGKDTLGGGVCRHAALWGACVNALAVNAELLPAGSVHVFRNNSAGKAHGWSVYATENNEQVFLIDIGLAVGERLKNDATFIVPRRIYNLKDPEHLCEILFIYGTLEMPGLLNPMLEEYGIKLPKSTQIQEHIAKLKVQQRSLKEQNAAREYKVAAKKVEIKIDVQEEVPTQPLENEIEENAEQAGASTCRGGKGIRQ